MSVPWNDLTLSLKKVLNLLEKLMHLGEKKNISSIQKLNILVANSFAAFFSLGAMIICASSLFFEKHHPMVWLMPFLCGIFLLPIFLNYHGYFRTSRIVLSICPSLVILSYSIISKLTIPDITFNDFYNFRIALSILCVLPLWIFSVKELHLLSWTFGVNFMCLCLTDVVHDFFNVGYYDLSFLDQGYDFVNITTIICTLILTYAIVFMKKRMEDSEVKNVKLVDTLKVTLAKIRVQNDVLVDQANRLQLKQDQLNRANEEIVKTKIRLEEELSVYDHEITQFSYNVCHHLRGPIASIAGLVNLLAESDWSKPEVELLMMHFKQTTGKLESVVHDLNLILRVRKDIFRIRTEFQINEIIHEAITLLDHQIQEVNALTYVAIEDVGLVYTSRASAVNILYNLLSNSLKFRSEERPLQIQVKCWREHDVVNVEILDNGIGFESKRVEDQLFKMYKRFHDHVEGKGLGLYLVNLQVIALGGSIKIESVPDSYTCCRLKLPTKYNLDLHNN